MATNRHNWCLLHPLCITVLEHADGFLLQAPMTSWQLSLVAFPTCKAKWAKWAKWARVYIPKSGPQLITNSPLGNVKGSTEMDTASLLLNSTWDLDRVAEFQTCWSRICSLKLSSGDLYDVKIWKSLWYIVSQRTPAGLGPSVHSSHLLMNAPYIGCHPFLISVYQSYTSVSEDHLPNKQLALTYLS